MQERLNSAARYLKLGYASETKYISETKLSSKVRKYDLNQQQDNLKSDTLLRLNSAARYVIMTN